MPNRNGNKFCKATSPTHCDRSETPAGTCTASGGPRKSALSLILLLFRVGLPTDIRDPGIADHEVPLHVLSVLFRRVVPDVP